MSESVNPPSGEQHAVRRQRLPYPIPAGSLVISVGAVGVAVVFAPTDFRIPLAVGGLVAALALTAALTAAAYYRASVEEVRREALAHTARADAHVAATVSAAQARIVEAEARIHSLGEQLGERERAAKDSENRRAAALAAFAGAAGRMQAMSTSMLAELREMEHRHADPKVLADLLELDHRTAQAGRLADSIAVLSGARSGRRWAKPIAMESILRGAMGRVAGYQRVRLRAITEIAIAGHAAEGIMHALAELLDNACNFSPPTTEVHVYAAEVPAGVVITIEDSGLVMSESALRRAESAVSRDSDSDLSSLSGTRLGLAVVGHLARKHDLTVSYRPSAIGGTAVVVVVPRELTTRLERQSNTLSRLTPVNTGSTPVVLPGSGERAPNAPSHRPDAPAPNIAVPVANTATTSAHRSEPLESAQSPFGAAVPTPPPTGSPAPTVSSRPTVDLPSAAATDSEGLGETAQGAVTSGGLPKRRRGSTLAAVHPDGLAAPTTAPASPRPASPPSAMAAFQRAASGREKPASLSEQYAGPRTGDYPRVTTPALTNLAATSEDLPAPDDSGTNLLPSSIADAIRRGDLRREKLSGTTPSPSPREYPTGEFPAPATSWETDR
ncbi:sensor histidine kinase [Nocardia sp. CDC160]|uniref:sensor histidine kinase n=1 Tax=Nocardia sp. CDC160 TaxID=3112166 RepID=UPI002DB7421C|nr:ATP-binding protein [Nocardia sp. CDC160]MEC3916047.1 ATP-binding protein [Nocardia sp. CDC160]